MIKRTVKQAVAEGYLVSSYTDGDCTGYDEKKGIRIEYKGNSVVGVDTYLDGGCCISCPVGRDHLDEHVFKSQNATIEIYS